MSALRRIRNRGGSPSEHERARTAAADRLLEALPAEESARLDQHLDSCPACREIADAYSEQAKALHALPLPEPPRDLWARTSAALDAEDRRRRPGRRAQGRQPLRGPAPGRTWSRRAASGRAASRRRFGPAPLGAFAGAMVVVVVVGAALLADRSLLGPLAPPAHHGAATPLVIEPQDVAWLAPRADGTYALNFARLDRVCPAGASPDCAPIDASARTVITLSAAPRAVVRSPAKGQLVVMDAATTSVGGTVYVVPVDAAGASAPGPAGTPLVIATATPSEQDAGTPGTAAPEASIVGAGGPGSGISGESAPGGSGPSAGQASSGQPEVPESLAPVAQPALTPTSPGLGPTVSLAGSAGPLESPGPSGAASLPASASPAPGSPAETAPPAGSVVPSATGSPAAGTPSQPIAIISDVIVVGESAAYSRDGSWFAFTARPADGSHGPDIYVWHAGDLAARPATNDHDSVFSTWLGDRILGSRPAPMDLQFEPSPSPTPSASPSGAEPAAPGTAPGVPGMPADSESPAAPVTDASPTSLPTAAVPSTSASAGDDIGDVPPASSDAAPAGSAGSETVGVSPSPAGTDSPAAGESSPSAVPTGVPGPSSPSLVARPLSFVVDPATGAQTDLLGAPGWRPIVDPTDRWVIYWSGSIAYDPASQTWNPADGGLVVAPLSALAGSALATIAPAPTLETSPEVSQGAASPVASIDLGLPNPAVSAPGSPSIPGSTESQPAEPGSGGPASPGASVGTSQVPGAASSASGLEPGTFSGPPASSFGAPVDGSIGQASPGAPAGEAASASPSASPLPPVTEPSPLPIAEPQSGASAFRDWDVRFDPTGSRLAIWTADPLDSAVGRLSLVAFDAPTGRVEPSAPLLDDQPALVGYSLDAGRLAWATPAGQDGQESRLQVLAWLGDGSGLLTSQSAGAGETVVVVR